MNFTNASSVFPILCRNQGCKGCMCPPSFWQISWPYINQESRLCSAHYFVPPRIFRPSDGPALGCHDGTQDLYTQIVCSYICPTARLHCDRFGLMSSVKFYKTEILTFKHLLKTGSDKMIYWLGRYSFILGFIMSKNPKFSMQPLTFFDIIKPRRKEYLPSQ
jgi:hypothetical protein